MALYIFIAKGLMFLWCIIKELSLLSNPQNDEDLPFHKYGSFFILFLSRLFYIIHIRAQYPNSDSVKACMALLFLLKSLKSNTCKYIK